MEFDDFLNKLGEDYNPDRAYKLYLQTQILILQEILVSGGILTREGLNRIEESVLNRVAEKTKK